MLSSIDFPNIVATLAAAIIGGVIAARIARHQINFAQKIEHDKSRRELGRDLLEAIDSYLHIAYRGDNGERLERQRLRRRILSLTLLTLPKQFDAVQKHLDTIDVWWYQQKQANKQKVKGAGLTATNHFFDGLKQTIFSEIFQMEVHLTVSNESQDAEALSQ